MEKQTMVSGGGAAHPQPTHPNQFNLPPAKSTLDLAVSRIHRWRASTRCHRLLSEHLRWRFAPPTTLDPGRVGEWRRGWWMLALRAAFSRRAWWMLSVARRVARMGMGS
jgi:hypothetical protein